MKLPEFSEEWLLALVRKCYREGQATFEVIPEKCALLVIDMQDEFVKPRWSPYWVPEATRRVPLVRQLIDACREREVPVIYKAFARTHRRLDRPKAGRFFPNHYLEMGMDNPRWFAKGAIYPELAPLDDEIVIYKPSYGAFYDTPLETILKNLEKDTVIICGTLTNYCCGTMARQAYERGFKVIFGSDVTSADDPELQEPELMVLRKGFAKVLTVGEIMAKLAG